MYHQLLRQITEDMKRFGRTSQPPCSSEQLQSLQTRTTKELNTTLPDSYLDFLKLTDGFFWNGLLIYGSERAPMVGRSDLFVAGFIEENLGYRDVEPLADYLIFGDDGVVFYTYHISVDRYEVILRVGLSILETFDSFDALLTNAFEGHL